MGVYYGRIVYKQAFFITFWPFRIFSFYFANNQPKYQKFCLTPPGSGTGSFVPISEPEKRKNRISIRYLRIGPASEYLLGSRYFTLLTIFIYHILQYLFCVFSAASSSLTTKRSPISRQWCR